MEAMVETDAQYRVMRESAGLLRRERRLIEVSGPDAGEYLQGQLTNEIESLSPGEGRYAALLDRKGHMQADLRVLCLGGGFLLDAEPAGGDPLLRHLSMYRIGSEVEISDVTDAWAVLSVIGPAAPELSGAGPLRPEHAHRELAIERLACRAVATDLGIDLLVTTADAGALSAALARAGVEAVTEQAAEILRVESGRPRFGAEMTPATIPQEAGINERAVSFTKGCYIGQETVARLHYRGKPNRHLRGLRLSGPADAGDAVRLGERELGTIGTAVLSPRLGAIALAVLRREAEPGATVMIGASGAAEVVELPF